MEIIYVVQQIINSGPEATNTDDGPECIPFEEGNEVLRNGEDETQEDTARTSRTYRCEILRRTFWIIFIVVLLVIGIGVGAGVGSGEHTGATYGPSQTPTILSHGVVNDSGLAVLSTPDGGRYVYCQDVNGSFRQEYYPNITPLPASSPNFIIPGTANARVNTPLSIFSVYTSEFGDFGDHFVSNYPIMYHVKHSWTVDRHFYSISLPIILLLFIWRLAFNDVWSTETDILQLQELQTHSGSRSLSISATTMETNGSDSLQLLIVLENIDKNVRLLRGSVSHRDVKTRDGLNPGSHLSFMPWNWTDVTQDEYGPGIRGNELPCITWNSSSVLKLAFLTPNKMSSNFVTVIGWDNEGDLPGWNGTYYSGKSTTDP